MRTIKVRFQKLFGVNYLGIATLSFSLQDRTMFGSRKSQMHIVSRVPYLNGNYKHVGLEIRLRAKRLGLGPILDYPSFAQWVQVGSSFAETVLTSLDALRLHGCELARDRLKFSREHLENTTLEKEYRRLWGLDFAFPQA
mmetsp:Transcript_37384/g.54701  ORF Transcript_37384/g.54701 Transcript_37384/m.54701 type:complete len:140 (-) Transcript_37384:247-666(-)